MSELTDEQQYRAVRRDFYTGLAMAALIIASGEQIPSPDRIARTALQMADAVERYIDTFWKQHDG